MSHVEDQGDFEELRMGHPALGQVVNLPVSMVQHNVKQNQQHVKGL